MTNTAKWIAAAAAVCCAASAGWADYDLRVDLKNVSGAAKADWPVILRVYTVLGRDLAPGSVRPEGFHVYDPAGKEVPHALVTVPPKGQPGNDELAFVIPKIQAGQTLTYRVTNTAKRSDKRTRIDLVSSEHNLIANSGFEAAGKFILKPEEIDRTTARSGKASLKISADNRSISRKYADPIKLHKGSWYYFGAWSKTHRVGRFGYQARGGGQVQWTVPGKGGKDAAAFAGQITPQCSTRDWQRMTFQAEPGRWGMDRYTARALGEQAALKLTLRQPNHFYMKEGETAGVWWLDDLVLIEQPEVTVRFDLTVKDLLQDGAMLFTRPPHTYLGKLDDKGQTEKEWCTYPFRHEKLDRLDKFALKGQRVSYCVGIYHTREIADVTVAPAGGGLAGPGGARLPVETVEYCPGFVGKGRGRYMKTLGSGEKVEAVTLAGTVGVRYFFLTFRAPPDATAGRYDGKVEVRFAGKSRRAVPLRLRVQDLLQKPPKDVYVGIIYQGGDPPFNEEGMKVYARSGFTSVTRFGSFLSYKKDANGVSSVDLEKLNEKMLWLKGHGLTGVCVFSDFDLGPKWNGGSLLRRVRPRDFNKGKKTWAERLEPVGDAWKAQIRRIEAARAKHPEWPHFIYMTFDEPNLHGGRNGKPVPAMRWVAEVAPEAWTTLDVQFDPLPVCLKWYTCPAFDDPANWAGPELYRWVKAKGKRFGFCGSARQEGDACRYQAGMLMVATGASYFHAWHLSRPQKMAANMRFDKAAGRTVRAMSMISWGEGMDDLKAYYMLTGAIERAAKSDDDARRAVAKSAGAYLKGVLAVFNGDHKPTWPNEPYLGTTTD